MEKLDVKTVMTGVAVAAAVAGAAAVAVGACRGSGAPKGELVANVADLPRGTMKEVKVGERTILLAHTASGNVTATSAKCTHYGAPLVKGVLSGDRVVCPWHAACFDVCTGDIEDGPVFDKLASYPTTVAADGGIFVALPETVPMRVVPTFATPSPADARSFVILGAGAAAEGAIEELRARGFRGRLTVVAKDSAPPHDRTKFSKNMAVKLDEILLRKPDWYASVGVDLRLGAAAVAVRPDKHEVVLESGDVLPYDKLLCATGGPARTFRKPEGFVVEGADAGNIFPLKDARHAAGIEALVDARGADKIRVVIVGSSFIGMEAAAYLNKSKKVKAITVVGMETQPFERVLGVQIGAFMRQMHEAAGVSFRMGAVVARFEKGPDGNVAAVVLKSGESLPADLVVVGAGIIPAVDYLKGAVGVTLLDKAPGGVRVDELLCAAPDVYAAGDIAYFPNAYASDAAHAFTRIEHWDVAIDQGRAAARAMLGAGAPYATVPFFWTAQYGKSVRYAGHAARTDEVIIHGSLAGDAAAFVAYFVVAGAVAAVATFQRDPVAVAAQELLRLRAMPSPKVLAGVDAFDLVDFLRAHHARA